MIQLSSSGLTDPTNTHLNTVQHQIDSGIDFTDRVNRAQSAWDSKTGSIAKKAAFDEIKTKLIDMCVGIEVCNYCENNEATDVEHIYPKSFFPERAFHWENYLLACKICNTGYKLDQFAVFDPLNSSLLVKLTRGNQPPTDDGAIINPRKEDPLHFFWLDIVSHSFVLDPRLGLNLRDKKRAQYTLDILGLNDRSTLVTARKAAAKYYLDRLERYIKTRNATTFEALEEVIQDPDLLDHTLPIEQERHRICGQIIKDIQTYAHPTVWEELKRQRAELNKTNRLLSQAPEALTW